MTESPTVTIAMDAQSLRVADATDPLELWQALRAFFQGRGRAVKKSATGYRYPETTNREVYAVAELLDRVLRRFARDDLHDGKAARRRWEEGRAEVAKLTTGTDPDAVYPMNERFWTYYAKHLCVYLSAASEVDTRAKMLHESFSVAWDEKWQTLSRAAGVAAEGAEVVLDAASVALGEVGEAIAKPIRRTLGSLLGPYVIPALIGGGVLAAVIVVPRFLPARRSTP